MGILCCDEKAKKNKINIEDKFENIKNKNISPKIFNKFDDNINNNKSKKILPKIYNNLEDNLKIIKSKYILQKIFNNLKKKKLLNTIKYNKNIKKRLDIDINDYKEEYSQIEIELRPLSNRYGKFINIDENTKYYHIYFNNNNKEEIKRNFINENEKIIMINIIIDYQIRSFKNLFKNCNCIKSIYFKKFYRNNINNMSFMFSDCSSLEELSLNNFKTINVTKMSDMFNKCSLLKELNLNNFNITNVINMGVMLSD